MFLACWERFHLTSESTGDTSCKIPWPRSSWSSNRATLFWRWLWGFSLSAIPHGASMGTSQSCILTPRILSFIFLTVMFESRSTNSKVRTWNIKQSDLAVMKGIKWVHGRTIKQFYETNKLVTMIGHAQYIRRTLIELFWVVIGGNSKVSDLFGRNRNGLRRISHFRVRFDQRMF